MRLTGSASSNSRHSRSRDSSRSGVQVTRSAARTIERTMTATIWRQAPQRDERRTGSRRRQSIQINCWRCCCSIRPTITALVISVLLAFGSCANSLKVTVSIPELVKLNDAFWLNCSYNNQHQQPQLAQRSLASPPFNKQDTNGRPLAGSGSTSERIYSIKWYKDEEEFYRYLPSAEPKVSIYETNGISLDQTKSHEGNVYMTKADVISEGVYRCEVLSEAPLFETVRKSKHLRVYALPIRGPRIEILDSNGRIKNPKAQEISYEVGDKIELRCNSAPSKPAARLRWYLNDRELVVPTQDQGPTVQHSSRGGSGGGAAAAAPLGSNGQIEKQPASGHNVRVTPIEHRQHYRNIYSSHSTLSLVLQRDDLINSRISFKCLASMRQEVPIASKQLYLLTPQHQSYQSGQAPALAARIRARSTSELIGASFSEVEPATRGPHQRHRAQYNRPPSPRKLAKPSSMAPSGLTDVELINSLSEEARHETLMYIYEDADSTLGPSIIGSPETLERYLAATGSGSGSDNDEPNSLNSTSSSGNYSLEFNRTDNLEFVQLMRDKYSRQRSYPGGSASSGAHTLVSGSAASGSGSGNQYHHKRLYGPNSLVRSPLYLDEFDPFRPILSWPPLEWGKLMLLPPSQSIVAIPTMSHATNRLSSGQGEPKFVMPPQFQQAGRPQSSSNSMRSTSLDSLDSVAAQQLILEKLVENLNCTCSEASIDTKLSWFVNEQPLGNRDTRHYPTRISADHRQTWTTIGLLQAPFGVPGGSSPLAPVNGLASILAQYYSRARSSSSVDSTTASSSASRTSGALRLFDGSTNDNSYSYNNNNNNRIAHGSQQQQQQVPSGGGGGGVPGNNEQQIKFMCQAIHSMLLYSSSEMITFDFNPPPVNQIDGSDSAGNSIDKFSSSPSNVIPAATASPTRSASSPGWKSSLISLGSHQQYATTSLQLLLLLLMPLATTLACSHWQALTIDNAVRLA